MTMITRLDIPEDADEQLAEFFGVAPGAEIGLVWSAEPALARYGFRVPLIPAEALRPN